MFMEKNSKHNWLTISCNDEFNFTKSKQRNNKSKNKY